MARLGIGDRLSFKRTTNISVGVFLQLPALCLPFLICAMESFPILGKILFLGFTLDPGYHVDEFDLLVSEVVKRRGGVPPKGKMKFWEAVLKDCKIDGHKVFNTPDAVRMRYERLKRKRRT